MSEHQQRRRWPLVCGLVSIVFFLIASPCVLFSVLGFAGILADVGPEENRAYAIDAFMMSAAPLAIGLVLAVLWLVGRRRSKSDGSDGSVRSSR